MDKDNNSIKMDKTSKIIISVTSSVIALLIGFNTYFSIFYYKPSKRKNNKYNLYSGNDLVIFNEELAKIKKELEEELKITIIDEEIDEYALLDAINKNDTFKHDNKDYYLHTICELIKDNPYLNKEEVYSRLLNVEIIYKKRPFYVDKYVDGQYYNAPYNSIGIFKEYPAYHETLHEIIHCIYDNNNLPRFFVEGMTELLNNEYLKKDNPFDGINSYPFEVVAVKMLCEVTSPNTVLKAFTLNDIDYIIEEMAKMANYGINKKDASNALKIMGKVLDAYANDEKSEYLFPDVIRNCISVFQSCIDTKNKDNISKSMSYYYNEMLFYNCLFKDKAVENYNRDLKRYGYDNKVYFSTYLKKCIENNISPYVDYSKEKEGTQFFIKK